MRKNKPAQQVLDEYNDVQVEAVSLLAQIPAEKVAQSGTMPWYGPQRCLADVIGIFYDHACEHCGQISTFRSRQK